MDLRVKWQLHGLAGIQKRFIHNMFQVGSYCLSLGYEGHIPSLKAENMMGESYAKITKKSILGDVHKGIDIEPKDRYESEYTLNHNEKQYRRYCKLNI